jgi:hypothetical protein
MKPEDCTCDEYSACANCLARLEADMLRLRALPSPETDSLEDRLLWRLARTDELPSERQAREDALYEAHRIGSGPINSRGVRSVVRIVDGT